MLKFKVQFQFLDSSIRSMNGNNNFSMPNETFSQSLLEKFENLTACVEDRILKQVALVKDPVFSDKLYLKSQSMKNLSSYNIDSLITGYTMGISIVQGQHDNNVYVKELVINGPGDRNGIKVGDQVFWRLYIFKNLVHYFLSRDTFLVEAQFSIFFNFFTKFF